MDILVKLYTKPNVYYDSVTLMLISKELKKLPGVREALVGMGTALNKEIAGNIGLTSPELDRISANNFFAAAESGNDTEWQRVLDKLNELLNAKKQTGLHTYKPPTLSSAVKMMPGINMAVISVPGQYAAGVAMDCLERDIHVMLFSDNVSIEEELTLKKYAVSKGLLMMGPDCGTAIINHVPLAFANVIRPGNIGIIGASGTGTQEVSSLIDQFGAGVSQVIGTGGRDLKEEIGGLMFSLALQALINDKSTDVIVLISKPPSEAVQAKILRQAYESGKPTVVCFIGGDPAVPEKMGLNGAVTLEDCARKAVALAKKEKPATFDGFTAGYNAVAALAREQAGKLSASQRFIRSLYTGGTLCEEAIKMLDGTPGHTFIDFGDDVYTVGRPHPMIDPILRNERVIKEAADPQTAVILLDCVIGYGAHSDAAGELARAIEKAKDVNRHQIIFIASVCGTENDPQGLKESQKTLEAAGALVFPSNAQASRFSGLLIEMLGGVE
jgi:succinyl-CoA synthetase alpha subunit